MIKLFISWRGIHDNGKEVYGDNVMTFARPIADESDIMAIHEKIKHDSCLKSVVIAFMIKLPVS